MIQIRLMYRGLFQGLISQEFKMETLFKIVSLLKNKIAIKVEDFSIKKCRQN